MSGNIKSKDLSFNKQEPAFLRRIREANASQGDRHERPVARPQRLRDPDADEEDAPTYVDEGGDALTKAEYDALANGDAETEEKSSVVKDTAPSGDVGGVVTGELEGNDHQVSGGLGEAGKKQKVVEVGGGSKKRKAAKIVGAEDGDADEANGGQVKDGEVKKEGLVKKAKKKAKSGVKLSFGDDEA